MNTKAVKKQKMNFGKKIETLEEMLDIAWYAIIEAGYEGYSNKLKTFVENNYD